jgi:F0F1-type ATP synthase assembly protein I
MIRRLWTKSFKELLNRWMKFIVTEENSTKSNRLAMALGASQLGFLVAGGLLGGLWIDKKFQTTPLFGLIGLVGGFAAGIRLLLRLIREVKRDGT